MGRLTPLFLYTSYAEYIMEVVNLTKEEERPIKLIDQPSVAAGGTRKSDPIILKKARTLSITTRVVYAAGADVSLVTRLYYVTEKGNHDTVSYTSISITVTAAVEVQRTLLVDPPEDGSMVIEVYNGDGQATGRVQVWYSMQRWPD